jgi:hypothetical protein
MRRNALTILVGVALTFSSCDAPKKAVSNRDSKEAREITIEARQRAAIEAENQRFFDALVEVKRMEHSFFSDWSAEKEPATKAEKMIIIGTDICDKMREWTKNQNPKLREVAQEVEKLGKDLVFAGTVSRNTHSGFRQEQEKWNTDYAEQSARLDDTFKRLDKLYQAIDNPRSWVGPF